MVEKTQHNWLLSDLEKQKTKSSDEMEEWSPKEITVDDIDKLVENLMNSEIKPRQCFKCSKEYFQSYGSHLDECDECFFARFPKEEREAFFRSFFE